MERSENSAMKSEGLRLYVNATLNFLFVSIVLKMINTFGKFHAIYAILEKLQR